MKTAESSRGSYAFPLRLLDESELLGVNTRQSNIRMEKLGPSLSRRQPEEIAGFIYAVLYSREYRIRYGEGLRIEFPKIPVACPEVLTNRLCGLGGELIELHLLESPKLDRPISNYIGPKNAEVEKVVYALHTVWLDKDQTCGFKGVPQGVWDFHIGGYQVCEKWLKDRKDRRLSKDDITHYNKIVVALSETIRLMNSIDEVIDEHGGWPGAFA
jgi:predicted helicase